MSRKRIPGFGKSGTSRTNRRTSSMRRGLSDRPYDVEPSCGNQRPMQLPPKKPQRHRRRKRDPKSSSDVVSAALESLGLTDYARQLRISVAWKEAVGPEI